MKKGFIIVCFILLLTPFPTHILCQKPQYLSYKTPYNLKNIDWDFDVYKYYCESNDVFAVNRDSTINGIPENPITVYVDTVRALWKTRTEEGFSDEKYESIGVEYNMMGWLQDHKIATYNNLYFSSMHMIANQDNEPIAICAKNDRTKEMESIKALLEEITKEGTTIDYKRRGFSITKDVYTWQEGNILFRLVVTPSQTKNDGIYATITEDEEWLYEFPKSYLFILKKEYEDKIGHIYFGDFSLF